MQKHTFWLYFFSIALCLGLGSLEGFLTSQNMYWYQSLQKPFFTPPNSVFGPVWALLYIMIGITLAYVWTTSSAATLKPLFMLQLLLNFIWTPLFFKWHYLLLALLDLSLLTLVLWFWLWTNRKQKVLFWLFLPYSLWVSFAWVLNLALWLMN